MFQSGFKLNSFKILSLMFSLGDTSIQLSRWTNTETEIFSLKNLVQVENKFLGKLEKILSF